jgi:hypothetical protein
MRTPQARPEARHIADERAGFLASFQNQYLHLRIFRQSMCKYAPGAAGTDDDHVGFEGIRDRSSRE